VKRAGTYYLIVSTTNLAYIGQPDLHADKAVRIYRSDTLDRGWEPYGHGGRHVILAPASELYGLNVLCDPANSGNTLVCRAFWVGDTSLPPSVYLTVGGDDPVLAYPADIWEEPDRARSSNLAFAGAVPRGQAGPAGEVTHEG